MKNQRCLAILLLCGPTFACAQFFVGVNGDLCKWDSIEQAINEAQDGDEIFIAAGTYNEQPGLVELSLTFTSAAADCRAPSNTLTTIDGNNNPGGVFQFESNLQQEIDVVFNRFSLINGNATRGGLLEIYNAEVTFNEGGMSGGFATQAGGCAYIDGGELIMNDSDASRCTTDGDGGAFYVHRGDLTIVNNSVIQNGNFAQRNGGAVAADNARVVIRDSSMRNNEAGDDGGGVHLTSNSSLSTASSSISANQAGGSGGGTYADSSSIDLGTGTLVGDNLAQIDGGGIYAADATFIAQNSELSNNDALGEAGGAMHALDSQLSIIDSVIKGNVAVFAGGAISVTGNTSSLQMTGGEVNNNRTTTQQTNRGGGGVVADGSFAVDLTGVTFDNNVSANSGGALELQGGVTATIDQCTFSNNLSSNGGAIIVLGSQSSAAIDRSTFTANTSRNRGGAISGFVGAVTVARSDFTDNQAHFGGAISTINAPGLAIVDCDFDANQANNNSEATGGAITINHSTNTAAQFSVSDSRFTSNQSTSTGGAIFFAGSDGDEDVLEISNTDFTANSAGATGGAIAVNDVTLLQISGGTFDQNTTTVLQTNQGGGAILGESSGLLSLADVVLRENTSANLGGAIVARTSTDIDIVGGTISGNSAGAGGGLYQASGQLSIDRTLFSNNSATSVNGLGGSIYVNGVDFLLRGSTLETSAARFGGGLFAWFSDGLVENTRFLNNNASEDGGAIRLFGTDLTIRSVTTGSQACDPTAFSANSYCTEIRGNSAVENGGGIELMSSVLGIHDSILRLQEVAMLDNDAGLQGAAINTLSQSPEDPIELHLRNVLIAGSSNPTDAVETINLDQLITTTIDSATIAGNGGAAIIANGPDATLELANTVLWDNGDPSFASLMGVTTTLNGCTFSEMEAASSWNLGSTVDPQFFSDPDRGDYRLDPISSPLIDNCAAGPAADLDGGGRPSGAGWEPGAFEVTALDIVSLLVIDPDENLNTSENGTSDQFSVRLAQAPLATVTVPLMSDNEQEGTLEATAPLVFTTANWDQQQTVTVTGVDDDAVDGEQVFSILLGPTSSNDVAYDSAAADVQVTNTDNDNAGIDVDPMAGLVTSESGTGAQFAVRLRSMPSANVSISVDSSDASEGNSSVSQLTFTRVNWAQPQIVTIVGADDDTVDGDMAYEIILGSATSADPNYAGLDPADVSVTNTDDDDAGIDVDPVAGLVTSESGTTAQFAVRLRSMPSTNVSISVDSSDASEGNSSVSQLTFTRVNWAQPQIVTIVGADDDTLDGDVAYEIILGSATSADPNYAGLDPADVSVTNTDNDVQTEERVFSDGFESTMTSGNRSIDLSPISN